MIGFDDRDSRAKHWTTKGTVHLVIVNFPLVSVWFERSDIAGAAPIHLGSAATLPVAAFLLADGAFDADLLKEGLPTAAALGVPHALAEWNGAIIPPEMFRGMPDL
jgi:hypothetical protein